jgi:hypothetical protein
MSETANAPVIEATCAQCSRVLSAEDRVASGDRLFCRSCYATLRVELEQVISAMSSNVNYANATLGAILGGTLGALVWWGFTALTHVALGLLAIAIGFLTGLGAVKFAGDKRSGGLQAISIASALVSYVVATYLVNMTFINKALAERGAAGRVEFPPQNLELFYSVVAADLGIMDLVFLAIVVYQAWKIPRPIAMPPAVS